MKLLDRILGRTSRRRTRGVSSREPLFAAPRLEVLEDRTLLDAGGVLNLAGTLTITTTPNTVNRVALSTDGTNLTLTDNNIFSGVFSSAAVTNIVVNTNGLFDSVSLLNGVTQPTTFNSGARVNYFEAVSAPSMVNGNGGVTRYSGGTGNSEIFSGPGVNSIFGGSGQNEIFGAGARQNYYLGSALNDTIETDNPAPTDADFLNVLLDPNDPNGMFGLQPTGSADPANQLNTDDVNNLLERASAATANDSAIIAIVDRSGRILGVRVEAGVSPDITDNVQNLVFAIDGAVAEARTGAFFGNDQAPLTSRTIEFISQSTITQQMIQSNPSITDPNSPLKGPGTVGPQGIGGNFPPGVANTPQVDLFAIEDTNRNTTMHPVYDANGNIIRYDTLPSEFNVSLANIPASIVAANDEIVPQDSYGFVSGLEPLAMPRGIGTLPGGIPIYKNGFEVGGIGVFFPGTTGFASEENSALSDTYNPALPDLSEEAEFVAFAALGVRLPSKSARWVESRSIRTSPLPRRSSRTSPRLASTSSVSRCRCSAPAAPQARRISSTSATRWALATAIRSVASTLLSRNSVPPAHRREFPRPTMNWTVRRFPKAGWSHRTPDRAA